MQGIGVQYDPMYENHLLWSTRVFVLYLALVLLVSAFRAGSLIRRLAWLRKIQADAPAQLRDENPITSSGPQAAEARFQFVWESCHAAVDSIRKLSMLTLLISLLVLAWGMKTTTQEVAVQKVLALGFLGGSIAQTLTTFFLGILVCVVLYAFTIFYEGTLARRKMDSEHAKRRNQAPTG
jgi:small-conductance mechanosensitive channel